MISLTVNSKLFVSKIAHLLQKYLGNVKQPGMECLLNAALFHVLKERMEPSYTFPSSNGLMVSAETHKGWIDLKLGIMLFLPLFQSIKHDEEHKRPSVF